MKKTFEDPELKRLGTVAELTKTNELNNVNDAPIGTPPPNDGKLDMS